MFKLIRKLHTSVTFKLDDMRHARIIKQRTKLVNNLLASCDEFDETF